MASDSASLHNAGSATQKKPQPFLKFLQRHLSTILAALCVIMLFLAGWLVYLLVTETFRDVFTCDNLIDRPLWPDPKPDQFLLCTHPTLTFGGQYLFGPFKVIGIGEVHAPTITIPILKDQLTISKAINPPLENVRRFVSWNIVIAFTLISLVLTFIVVKVKGFVEAVMDPVKRQGILQNISIYLVIFAVIGGLFYFTIVANH